MPAANCVVLGSKSNQQVGTFLRRARACNLMCLRRVRQAYRSLTDINHSYQLIKKFVDAYLSFFIYVITCLHLDKVIFSQLCMTGPFERMVFDLPAIFNSI